jgi:hypothetical protein
MSFAGRSNLGLLRELWWNLRHSFPLLWQRLAMSVKLICTLATIVTD